ncbi:hypothetical protein WICPIJ_009709 [Wickerhamomyces pijperi]|uniref:Uncharacterized protein n=1 Tax=Wickerhamomyces pijperi TaxID=599730 RepID=A0A9P8PLJ5_WICPI|nr:hypothetical protein WICPIJ_009709 [Wickerhamomyces pijperi]
MITSLGSRFKVGNLVNLWTLVVDSSIKPESELLFSSSDRLIDFVLFDGGAVNDLYFWAKERNVVFTVSKDVVESVR